MNSDFTTVGELPVPKRLIALIETGIWPGTHAEAESQNIRSLVSADRIHLFAPEENGIYLAGPPFCTIADRMMDHRQQRFWSRWGALEEISPELAVDIGYFGLGSDTCIVLDYRQGTNPSVIRLKWQSPQPNTWVLCAETFDEFADMLGLDKRETQ